MAKALIVTVIEAVIADLRARAWPVPFVLDRRYIPRYALDQTRDGKLPDITSDVRAYIRPTKRTPARLTRGSRTYSHELEIGFYKRVSTLADPLSGVPFDQDEVDRLIYMVEAVEKYLSDEHRLPDLERARCVSAETDPVYDPEALEGRHVFASRLVVGITEEPVT